MSSDFEDILKFSLKWRFTTAGCFETPGAFFLGLIRIWSTVIWIYSLACLKWSFCSISAWYPWKPHWSCDSSVGRAEGFHPLWSWFESCHSSEIFHRSVVYNFSNGRNSCFVNQSQVAKFRASVVLNYSCYVLLG